MCGPGCPRSLVILLDAGADTIIVEADGHGAGGTRGRGAREQRAGVVLDQCVAAGESPLGAVGRERRGEALEVAAPALERAVAGAPQLGATDPQRGGAALAIERGAVRLPRDHQQMRGGQLATLGEAPAGGRAELAYLLVGPCAMTSDVLGPRPRHGGQRASAPRHRPAPAAPPPPPGV